MSYKNIVILILITIILGACQNDVKQDTMEEKSDSLAIVANDTITSAPIVKDIKKEKKAVHKKEVTENKETVVEPQKEETKEDKLLREKVLKEETAKDLESEVNRKVNRVIHPDNNNGSFEIKEDANITVVPIITLDDKAKYYVQFTIKLNKISKVDLTKYFPDTQKIYVIEHKGLYKYCVGQFDNEEDAINYKKEVDKEFRFENSEVVTYSEAW